MREIILLWLFLCFTIPLSAQVLTIKDRITHQPLELVNVYSDNPSASDVTDAQGHADLTGFQGADSIRVELIGSDRVSAAGGKLQTTRSERVQIISDGNADSDE